MDHVGIPPIEERPGEPMQSGEAERDIFKFARYYLALGFSVIPILGPNIIKGSMVPKGKMPAIPWKEYQMRQPTLEEVEGWFGRGNPKGYGIGIVCGAISDLAVVDFDTKEAVELANARQFPVTPLVRTAKGYHAYCRYKDGVRNFQKRGDLPGIDLRGEGGYVVAPPSIHEAGRVYHWVEGHGLSLDPAPLPEWLWAERPEDKQPLSELYAGTNQGARNNALARLVGSWVNDGGPIEEIINQALGWNKTNQPPLPDKEVEATTRSIFKRHQKRKMEEAPIIWEEPLLFGKIDTPEIPASILPCWMGEYVEALTLSTQTPSGLAVIMSLSVAATCLQKKFTVSPYKDYCEPVNLWTVTALPPASRKTAVISALTAPLEKWERDEAERLAPEIRRVNIRRDTNLMRIEKLKKKAVDCVEPEKQEEILVEIAIIEEETPAEMKSPRLWTADITPERLQNLLVEQGECMALLSDEGGIFEVMAGLYSDGRVNVDVFLQAHAGKSMRADRAGRSAYLDAPALTFGLAIQPAVIADFSKGSKRRFRGNGTLARFLYCIPRNNIGTRDVRRRLAISEGVKARYSAGINSLLEISPRMDSAGRKEPWRLDLDAQALDSWYSFSEFIEKRQGPNGEFEPIQDWTGKLPGAALRVSGLFHIIEHGPTSRVISQATIEKAIDLCKLLIGHARAAFDLMGADQATSDAKLVFHWIIDRGKEEFKRSECHKELQGRFPKVDRLARALEILQQRAIISGPERIPTAGRPSIIYWVNPAVLQGKVP